MSPKRGPAFRKILSIAASPGLGGLLGMDLSSEVNRLGLGDALEDVGRFAEARPLSGAGT